jgi:hypothetical protein
VSTEEFCVALETIVDELSGAEILAIPGAFEVLSEALNNEAIARARDIAEEEDRDVDDLL